LSFELEADGCDGLNCRKGSAMSVRGTTREGLYSWVFAAGAWTVPEGMEDATAFVDGAIG
jgi:hypothetical protein